MSEIRSRGRTRIRRPRKVSIGGLLVGAICTAIALLVLYPLVRMLLTVFFPGGELDLSAFSEVAQLSWLGSTLRDTAFVVAVAGGLALLAASLLAWLNERTDARMGWLSEALPIIPLLIPPIALGIGWLLLLSPGAGSINVLLRNVLNLEGTSGPINIYSLPGLIFLYSLELFPFAYLIMSSALRNLDSSVEEASRMSGAGPLSTLRRVTLPAVRPALGASALLVLVMGLALFSAASLVGRGARVDILSVRIVELLKSSFPPETGQAVVLSTFILLVIGAGGLMQRRLLRRGHYAKIGGRGARATRVRLGAWRWPARLIMFGYIALGLLLPVAALCYVSLQKFWSTSFNFGSLGLDSYRELLIENENTRLALINSVLLGVGGGFIGITLAVIVALAVRRRPGRATRFLDGVAQLPAALSHIVVAVAVLVTFGATPFSLGGTLIILLIGYVIIYLPQGSISAGSSVNVVGDDLLEASHMAGAGAGRTLLRIGLPLMMPGLAAGWALLFALMVGDLTASVLLSGLSTPTVGVTILDLFHNGSFPLIAALSLIVTLTCSIVVLSAMQVMRRMHRTY